MEDVRGFFSKAVAKNFVFYKQIEKKSATLLLFPRNLSENIYGMLESKNISSLYSHQKKALEYIFEDKNVVITTGVASGKSLCYQIPILQKLDQNCNVRCLLLFPTKALTQDQNKQFINLVQNSKIDCKTGIYDGDTPKNQRKIIREKANLIFTNPDMIHLGILPHHTQWRSFFSQLKFIVIDEIHTYRGIFGSHFTNVIRRLKRIANFYGSDPQFILTSATVSNVKSFAEKLINDCVEVIDEDGSPQPEKHILFYNPPVINQDLGIRANVLKETVRVANDLLMKQFQTLIFSDSRRSVEIILRYLQNKSPKIEIKAYRSGYLPNERRKLEQQLKNGSVQGMVSTNALELGIDIGGLDAVILCGYPGSISSSKQQMGRAGRSGKKSISIYVASSLLMDQFILTNPEYLLEKESEEALINPDNPYILLDHIRCALFEKPFNPQDSFGDLPDNELQSYLNFLVKIGNAYQTNGNFYWKKASYPANEISLRTAVHNTFSLQAEGNTIGIIDGNSVYWMCHPNAIYLHNGKSYYIQRIDRDKGFVEMNEVITDYYTQAQSKTSFEILQIKNEEKIISGMKKWGELEVTEQVTGYKKLKWHTNENLGVEKLDLPPRKIKTIGCWFSIESKILEKLEKSNDWSKTKNNYGKNWGKITTMVRTRDQFSCKHCGAKETDKKFHVHHKKPLRTFQSIQAANHQENLITLCPTCHHLAERQQYIQSGFAGLTYLLHQISPIFLMCDSGDIRFQYETNSKTFSEENLIIAYDAHPGGIGLAQKLYEIYYRILWEAFQVVLKCVCKTGCPSCVGPVSEHGEGAKEKVKALLRELLKT